jgi:hypothetical protein
MKNYLFSICVSLLENIGRKLHLNYKQISVYINLYLQGSILLASPIPFLVVTIIQKHLLFTILASFIFCFYLVGFICMMKHYKLPQNINFAFDQCVRDLQFVASKLNMSYQKVNILIFVIGFLLTIIIHICYAFLAYINL